MVKLWVLSPSSYHKSFIGEFDSLDAAKTRFLQIEENPNENPEYAEYAESVIAYCTFPTPFSVRTPEVGCEEQP